MGFASEEDYSGCCFAGGFGCAVAVIVMPLYGSS
jgi:hypothetical protein